MKLAGQKSALSPAIGQASFTKGAAGSTQMRTRQELPALSEDELDFLRACLDMIVARNVLDRAGDTAEAAAASLFAAYGHGVRDKDELIRIGESAIT